MKLKKYLTSIGVLSTFALPISLSVACANKDETNLKNNPQEQKNKNESDLKNNSQEKKFVFDKELLDKFPKKVMISFYGEESEQLIKSKIKVAIDKDTKDLSREDKQAFNFFLENYFDNGNLDTKEETFTIKHDDYEYVIEYEKGNIVEVKIEFDQSDNAKEIIDEIVEVIDSLEDPSMHDLWHIFAHHKNDGELNKKKQKLIYPSIHGNLPYTIYYEKK